MTPNLQFCVILKSKAEKYLNNIIKTYKYTEKIIIYYTNNIGIYNIKNNIIL